LRYVETDVTQKNILKECVFVNSTLKL